MKVLATGASGFIGTNFVNAALARGYDVLNLDLVAPYDAAHNRYWRKGDIMDRDGLLRAFGEYRPDYVVHLAARADCDENTTVEKGYTANTTGTQNVLDAVKATDSVRRLVVTSTQFVFNKGPVMPTHDEDYAPRTVYGHSKIVTEQLTRKANLPCGWTIVRPTNIWGPWSKRHVDTFFKALKGGFYLHPGRKPCLRSYGYVGNVVDQMLRCCEAPLQNVNGKTLYVGDAPVNLLDWCNSFSNQLAGRDVRVIPRWLVRIMAKAGDAMTKVTGKRAPIDSTRFDSMTEDYLTPMDKTFAAIGQPKYTVEQGMEQTLDWVRGYAPHLFSGEGVKNLTQPPPVRPAGGKSPKIAA